MICDYQKLTSYESQFLIAARCPRLHCGSKQAILEFIRHKQIISQIENAPSNPTFYFCTLYVDLQVVNPRFLVTIEFQDVQQWQVFSAKVKHGQNDYAYYNQLLTLFSCL